MTEYVYRLPVPSGVDGHGITAAIMDTGIAKHPDFDDRVIVFKDFVNGKKTIYDDNGHGTHVAGILAGSGKMSRTRCRGMAPGIKLVSLKVLDQYGNGSLKNILQAVDWLLQNHRKYQIRIVNISIGTTPDRDTGEDSLLMKGIDALWDENVCVFAAAGNSGPGRGSITSPGINRRIITVGCCEPFVMMEQGRRIGLRYPGRGPVCSSCVMKPEVIAFGRDILSCNSRYLQGQRPYVKKSGTSMAVPMAAGSAALLLQRYPELSNGQVKLCFRESSQKLSVPENQQGWGLIQPDRLLQAGKVYV